MRKSSWILVFVCLVWGFAAAPLFAEERILRFDVEATVEEGASLIVTERIAFTAEGKDIKRGLYRTFPTDFTDAEGVRRRAGFELLSAELDGAPTPSLVERVGENLDIRLGDLEKLLSYGEHQFSITYRTSGQLGFFKDHDELYWNVTGNDWAFPIEKASFRLRLPGRDFGADFSSIEFYTGKEGEQRQDAIVTKEGAVESTRLLSQGEGLTVVYTWPKGIVAPPAEPAPVLEKWTASPYRVAHLAMPVFLALLMTLLWVLWGKDPPAKPIFPRFAPPRGIEAGFSRYIRSMRMDDQAFAAMVLGLAVKGPLTIEERSLVAEAAKQTGKDVSQAGMGMKLLSKLVGTSYILRLNREKLSNTTLTIDERVLVDELFGSTRNDIHLSSADRPVIQDAFRQLGKRFKERAKPFLKTNTGKWLVGVALFEIYAVVMLVLMILSGEGRFEPVLALMAGPFLLLPFAVPVPSGKGGFASKFFLRGVFPGIFLFVTAGAVLAGSSSGIEVDLLSVPGPFLCVLVLLLFKPLMRIRSEEGARLNEELEGLRMFMTAAEKHRLELENPPDETPQLFEALLPYAFALDVAETWANRFESILAAAHYAPSWYRGDMHTFTQAAGVAAFASGFAGAVASGTRSSGSGGSGSSGGGGGGGGGRGW